MFMKVIFLLNFVNLNCKTISFCQFSFIFENFDAKIDFYIS